ncbi:MULTISPECIES: NAD-dependent deacylase [unclassified Arcicella]|uniref:SIR2 family NAD-dependent protein deacylase n=1 Tax=unclassified Arcicella TaxID=2644986 RepID=UPI00285D0A1E|nr:MULTISPECIES: NAD-dependent deacylase [unclassified Arcicella]MDR6561858.1 NAD-dependent deacetylase [Arcicella sp. BE51]MDR6814004.1 NAD-dependent deacetylase [Arcicella sp. BE140]MDR6825289.1 NAD-dependent deacetylase [Arcicella sp. BE139]
MNPTKKKLVVLTGAGISAESGIPTFRASDGLWENHAIEDVATPQGFKKDPELVLRFYNERRAKLDHVEPNEGHKILARLEQYYDVQIITQNVDNLHERAGSTNVLHLHGELTKARSTVDEQLVYDIGTKPINLGDKCEKGSQLRPHIVWFHEDVPLIHEAIEIAESADIFVVVGTSLQVYPAAGLVNYVLSFVPIYVIDPKKPEAATRKNMSFIEHIGSVGLAKLWDILVND